MKLDRFVEKRTAFLLWIIFGASILTKIFVIPLLGAVSFPLSDEHLYIELAEAIFFRHDFLSNIFPNIIQFREILYPLLLSPLYAFFSPENFPSVLRIFGLIAMSSAVFPAYKLGISILHNKKKALLVSLIAILIPEMTLAFSIVQEVIYYPLFLFAIYLVYKKTCGDKVSPIYLGFIFFLLWSCKAIGATVFVGYVLFSFFDLIFIAKLKNFKASILQIMIVGIVVFSLRELSNLALRFINFSSFAPVRDYWTVTASSYFSAGLNNLFSDLPNGVFHYLFFTSLIFMVFPLILPFDNIDQYELRDRKFLAFISMSFMITMLIVVILIYKSEGGAAREVQRVHYRYLFVYFVPFSLMMMKLDFSKIKLKLFGIISMTFILLYKLLFQPTFTRGSTIDAKSLLLITEIQTRIIKGDSLLFIVMAITLILGGYLIYSNKNYSKKQQIFMWIFCIILALNHGYATFSTYKYYTAEANGMARQKEYSAIGSLLDSVSGNPILFNPFGPYWYDILFTTQSNKDIINLENSESPVDYSYDTSAVPSFIITPKNLSSKIDIQNAELVETNLQTISVYQLTSPPTGKLKFNYILQNTYADDWLMDNAILFISNNDGKNEVYISLDLVTDGQAENIVATLTDSTGKVTFTPVGPLGSSVTLTVNKKPADDYFSLSLGSKGYFIPTDTLGNATSRKLTYKVTRIVIK